MDLNVYIQKSLSVEILSLHSHHVPSYGYEGQVTVDAKNSVTVKQSKSTYAICRYSRLEFYR